MICNEMMRKIGNCIREFKLIERIYTDSGEDYYCFTNNFCLDKYNIKKKNRDLTEYEWEGNELFYSSNDNNEILEYCMLVINSLKYEMITNYRNIEFDIVAMIDSGDEYNDYISSANIRFYKVRDNYHLFELSDIESYMQPVMIENVK